MGISDREISRRLDLRPATLNEWKSSRPELYQHIVQGYKCKELLESMEVSVDEVKAAIEQYKSNS